MAKATDAGKPGYKQLKAELRKSEFRRLYVLYGDETFLIDKLVSSLQDLLISPGSAAIDSVVLSGGSAGKITIDRLRAEVMTPPFLSRCKLVVVRGSGLFSATDRQRPAGKADVSPAPADDGQAGNPVNVLRDGLDQREPDQQAPDDVSDEKATKGRQQELIKLLSDIPDSACLVFIEDKVDKRQKTLINLIEQKGVLAEIGQEQPALLRQWVEAECKQRGLGIEPLAAESLVDRCDNSMQVLWQEMTKIFLYMTYSRQTRIDLQIIETLSLPDLRGNIFDMTDAISRGQTARALELVDLLLGQKEPVQLIAFMLARHFRQLICAKDLGRTDALIRDLKVMPFVANRLLQQAKALSVEQMEKIYSLCFETDLAVKTGQLPERIALEILLVSAAEAARPSGKVASGSPAY